MFQIFQVLKKKRKGKKGEKKEKGRKKQYHISISMDLAERFSAIVVLCSQITKN
jgi:hypothetical protein